MVNGKQWVWRRNEVRNNGGNGERKGREPEGAIKDKRSGTKGLNLGKQHRWAKVVTPGRFRGLRGRLLRRAFGGGCGRGKAAQVEGALEW